jgi:hypothetical protein
VQVQPPIIPFGIFTLKGIVEKQLPSEKDNVIGRPL